MKQEEKLSVTLRVFIFIFHFNKFFISMHMHSKYFREIRRLLLANQLQNFRATLQNSSTLSLCHAFLWSSSSLWSTSQDVHWWSWPRRASTGPHLEKIKLFLFPCHFLPLLVAFIFSHIIPPSDRKVVNPLICVMNSFVFYLLSSEKFAFIKRYSGFFLLLILHPKCSRAQAEQSPALSCRCIAPEGCLLCFSLWLTRRFYCRVTVT